MAGDDRRPPLLIDAIKGDVISIFAEECAIGIGITCSPGGKELLQERLDALLIGCLWIDPIGVDPCCCSCCSSGLLSFAHKRKPW